MLPYNYTSIRESLLLDFYMLIKAVIVIINFHILTKKCPPIFIKLLEFIEQSLLKKQFSPISICASLSFITEKPLRHVVPLQIFIFAP